MAWNVIDLAGARIESVDTAAVFPVGQRCTARNTSTGAIAEFQYGPGAASVAIGSWVILDHEDGATELLSTSNDDSGKHVGVAMAAISATTSYGWYCVRGYVQALTLANMTENTACQTTATAGSVDDTATVVIVGAYTGDTAQGGSAGLLACVINYPHIT